jgi:hypothetical protein
MAAQNEKRANGMKTIAPGEIEPWKESRTRTTESEYQYRTLHH